MKIISPLEHGKFYHIFNRGINSDVLFKTWGNYEYFLKLYDNHVNAVAETYAWCLMKNHFHFLVKIKDVDAISLEKKIPPSQSFSNLFNAYSKAFNKSYNRHGPLFERPFQRKEIDTDEYLKNVIIYIHNNPVHHHICSHPSEYPWSSHSDVTGFRNGSGLKINRDETIELFSDLENFRSLHQQKTDDDTHLTGF